MADKVAVVPGASQGLGQYLSLELAGEGAKVVLVARNAERIERTAVAIAGRGGTALAIPADLADARNCELVIEKTLVEFGSIDILVLNDGSATYGKLEELDQFAPIRSAMEVNFFGTVYPTFLSIHRLIASKGMVVYITSGSGHLPMAGYLGYTTRKHAVNGFFEALRLEMFDRGVNVLAFNPGRTYNDDGAGRTFLGPDGASHKFDLSPGRKNDIRRVPAGSVAERVLEAIIERRREIDLSPGIQKLATRVRPFLPSVIDRLIYRKATQMRTALTPSLAGEIAAEARRDQRRSA